MADTPDDQPNQDDLPAEDELRKALEQIKFKANRGTYIVLPRSPGSFEDE